MEFSFLTILLLIATIISVAGAIYLFVKLDALNEDEERFNQQKNSLETAKKIAREQIAQAEAIIKELQSNNSLYIKRKEVEIREREEQLKEDDKSFLQRQENAQDQEQIIIERKKELSESTNSLQTLKQTYFSNLNNVAKTSTVEIEKEIKNEIHLELSAYLARKTAETIAHLKNNAEIKAQNLLNEVLPTAYVDLFTESTNSKFLIEDEHFEKLFGTDNKVFKLIEDFSQVEIKVEESKKEGFSFVIVSNIEPIRREVGSRIVERLINRKRKELPDIEKQVQKEKTKLLQEIKKAADMACKEVQIELSPKIKTLLGKGKYRYSYGQNLLKHHMEVAKLAESLAVVLHTDKIITKLAAFVHDIGKVVPEEEGTPHHHISAEVVKEFYESEVLYNAIIAHHYDVDAKYPEAEIIRLVDSISGARPGARRNSVEEYFEKVKQLQEIASGHNGVKDAYAINGAREVRIIVNPKEVSDKKSQTIADKVAAEIEETMGYPGTIKVNVIREVVETVDVKAE